MPKKQFKSSSTRSSKRTKFSPRFVPGIKAQDFSKQGAQQAKLLKKKFTRQRDKAVNKFVKNHPHADDWLGKRKLNLADIRLHSQKVVTGVGLSAALALSTPISPGSLPVPTAKVRLAEVGIAPTSTLTSRFLDQLKPLIPKRIGHLDPSQEKPVQKLIADNLGINATSTLEGQRLNHSIGWIGYEQHLERYPGDSLSQHDEERRSGIAPGRGAWGHFVSSKNQLTQDDTDREKYYLAVQTLYLPTWKKDLKFLREWYKYRKMLVVNVDNGEAVVAVIGDAGPAAWTGKQFGGSPEVMRTLDLTGKKSKGKVIIYFVDDPNNTIPLGPVKGKIGEQGTLT